MALKTSSIQDPTQSNDQDRQLKTISILLVEDDEDDIYLVRSMLKNDEQKDYEIDTCNSLSTAISALENKSYSVVLLDLGLQDCEGLETLVQLSGLNLHYPIVVLTGANDPLLGERAIKMGAEDYLPKQNMSTFLLSRSISHSIERHRLLIMLRKQAEIDVLSGLANRLVLFRTLDMLIEQMDRNSSNLAVALIDLDGFKQVNDNLGHKAGDELITKVGSCLNNKLRKTDLAARYGGDEFVLVIVNYADELELKKILENKHAMLLKAVEKIDSEKPDTGDIKVGVSMGVAQWEKGLTPQDLLSIADKRMYKSKQKGESEIYFD